MTPHDIEAQLSYAYLHAVASHAGIACQEATRSHDNLGIDAHLCLRRDFGSGAILTDVTLHVQLKATIAAPVATKKNGQARLSYFLREIEEYDSLRAARAVPQRFVAVLFLPGNHSEWLTHSPERLALHRCAYWVSLRGAPASANASGQTVYLPQSQPLSPAGLLSLFERLAREEDIHYDP